MEIAINQKTSLRIHSAICEEFYSKTDPKQLKIIPRHEIMRAACLACNISSDKFFSKSRKPICIIARILYTVYQRTNTKESLEEIGDYLSKRDHATVYNMLKRHEHFVYWSDKQYIDAENEFYKILRKYYHPSDYSFAMEVYKKKQKNS